MLLAQPHEIDHPLVVFNARQSCAHVIAIGWTSVRPSVRHTFAICRNGSTYRQTVFTAR